MSFVIILALSGIIFISLEAILPGMVMGILGVILCFSSIAVAFITDDLPPAFLSFGGRFLLSTIILLVTVISIGFWLKYFDKFPWTKGLILRSSSDGKIESTDESYEEMIGITGQALSDLKPTGKVKIEGLPETSYVIAEDGFIEAGSAIKIIQVEGRTVTVRQITT
ncbi:MAG: hypothetical protein CMO73_01115 [Verrucomicrobiales bacterium]|nr:hypothetical protein [Verrucomicrobiales bacterium]